MGSTTRPRRLTTGDEAALVARLHAGDRDAFDRLYRQYRPALTRWVAARLPGRDHAAVDDCVHDAFCAALADPTQVGADVRGSLLRLAARACHRAERSRRGEVRITDLVYTDTIGTVDGEVASGSPVPAQRRVWIGHALDQLGDEHRRVIELRYLHGHPAAVVAALTGRTVTAVRTLHRQALRRLRAEITAAAATGTDEGPRIPAASSV